MAVLPYPKNTSHNTSLLDFESGTEPAKLLKYSGKRDTRVAIYFHGEHDHAYARVAQQTPKKGVRPPTTSTLATITSVLSPGTGTTQKLPPSIRNSNTVTHSPPTALPRTRFHSLPTIKSPTSEKTQTGNQILSSSAIIGIAVGSLFALMGIYLVIRLIIMLKRRTMPGFLPLPESGYINDKHDAAGQESPLFGTNGQLSPPERPGNFTWSWIAYPQGNNDMNIEVNYPFHYDRDDLDAISALQPVVAVTRATNGVPMLVLPHLGSPCEEAKATYAAGRFESKKKCGSKDSCVHGGCRRTCLGSAGVDMAIELPLLRRHDYTRGRIQAPYYMVGSYPRLSATRVQTGVGGPTKGRLLPTMLRGETEHQIERPERIQKCGLGLTPTSEDVVMASEEHGQKLGRVPSVFVGGSDQGDRISDQHRRLGTMVDGRIAAVISSNDASVEDTTEGAGAIPRTGF